jgi:hypothetical protein
VREIEQRLVAALSAEARGPRRNGIYAVWLVTRVAEGMLPPDPLSPRAHQRRLEALQRRLTSVTLPAPLRRAVAGAIRLAADGSPRNAAMALHQLVAPVQETLGADLAETMAQAVARARRAADGKEP